MKRNAIVNMPNVPAKQGLISVWNHLREPSPSLPVKRDVEKRRFYLPRRRSVVRVPRGCAPR